MKYFVEFKTIINAESERELKQKIREKLTQWSLNENFSPLSVNITTLPSKGDKE